ncbi:MAG TPA: hypothetical protein VE974_18020 [Thermoanaerobaculia bacterium]|nr:hypothetical protein [Thermoanaerobaculia bacterium]
MLLKQANSLVTRIWYRFADFASDFYDTRVADGYTDEDLSMMPAREYIDFIRGWVKEST